ncbi:MAG: hypothetical protein AABZ80_02430 [Gemmatimonadota bacterium]
MSDRQTGACWIAEAWRKGTWILAFALPGMAMSGDDTQRRTVPMKDVAIRGSAVAATRAIALVVQSVIGTPIGRIPVNARMRLTYDCQSRFTGAVTYHPLVRLFAKIKGVDLVAHMQGSVSQEGGGDCPLMDAPDIQGRAKADATEMSGFIWLGRDSLGFRGPAWMLGDTSYHSVLAAQRGARKIVLRVSMYEQR